MGNNPLFMGHHECHGSNGMASRWIWRGVALRAANRCGGWRKQRPASYFHAITGNTGAKYYTQTNHRSSPKAVGGVPRPPGTNFQGQSGLVSEVRARSPDGAAGPGDKSVAENTAKLKSAGVEFITVDNKPSSIGHSPVRAKMAPTMGSRSCLEAVSNSLAAAEQQPCFVSWAMPLCGCTRMYW